MEQIFRKKALERLRSPEQLDQLLSVTSPRMWLALVTLWLLIAVALVWGFLGRVSTKVYGTGIYQTGEGLYDVVALGEGILDKVVVRIGDQVHPGQVVALLNRPELVEQLRSKKESLAELEARESRGIELVQGESAARSKVLSLERTNTQQQTDNLKRKLDWLATRIAAEEELLRAGLVTKQSVVNLQEEQDSTRLELARSATALETVVAQEAQLAESRERDINTTREKLDDARREVHVLEVELDQTSRVLSPYAGRLAEIMADQGRTVRMGQPIVSIEPAEKRSWVDFYLPATSGKEVQPGAAVQITPSTIKREEYGYILSQVVYAAEFPATPEGLAAVLSNDELVRVILSGGPVLLFRSRPLPDSSTVSGLKWSSHKGSAVKLTSGTLCSVEVVVKEQAPITLVIPKLRTLLGI